MAKGGWTINSRPTTGGLGSSKRKNKRKMSTAVSTLPYKIQKISGKTGTVTRPVKSKIQKRAIQDGPAGSVSFTEYHNAPLKLPTSVLKELCWNYRITNAAGQATSTPGVQVNTPLLTMFHQTDVVALNGITSLTNGRAILKSVRGEVFLTNASNATARVTLYDVVARRDISDATITDAVSAWNQGDTDEGGSSAIPCSEPKSSKSFTQMFKVVGKTDMLLAQGASHFHTVNFSPNKSIDYGVAHYAKQYRDITFHVFMVSHGQVDDAVTGGAGAGIGASKVNWAVMKEYQTSFLTDSTTNYAATNSLPTSFTGGENLMDMGDGVAATYATA
jgi:hypothetical protein